MHAPRPVSARAQAVCHNSWRSTPAKKTGGDDEFYDLLKNAGIKGVIGMKGGTARTPTDRPFVPPAYAPPSPPASPPFPLPPVPPTPPAPGPARADTLVMWRGTELHNQTGECTVGRLHLAEFGESLENAHLAAPDALALIKLMLSNAECRRRVLGRGSASAIFSAIPLAEWWRHRKELIAQHEHMLGMIRRFRADEG